MKVKPPPMLAKSRAKWSSIPRVYPRLLSAVGAIFAVMVIAMLTYPTFDAPRLMLPVSGPLALLAVYNVWFAAWVWFGDPREQR